MNYKDTFHLLQSVFTKHSKMAIASTTSSTLFAVVDALSVVSLIPIIEYLNSTPPSQYSTFTIRINSLFSRLNIDTTINNYFILFAVIITFKAAFNYLTKYFVLKTRVLYETDLGLQLFEALTYSRGQWLNKHNSGEVSNYINVETQKIGECLYYAFGLMAILLKFVFYFSILLSFSISLVLMIGSVSIFTLLPSLIFNKKIFLISNERVILGNNINNHLIRVFDGLVTIKSFAAEHLYISRFKHSFLNFKLTHAKMILTRELSAIIYEPISVILVSIIIIISINYFNLTFAEVLIVLYTLRNLLPLVSQFTTNKQVIISSTPSFVLLKNFIDETLRQKENYSGINLHKFESSIIFDNISFSYNHSTEVLKNLCLQINKGETVAFVGPSGSGKSTIIKLLTGLNHPTSGKILIDSLDMSNLSISSWRSHIGFVSQETIILSGTIIDNVSLGEATPNEDRVIECLHLANIYDEIISLPNGLNTILEEEGSTLSGGQKQRLAIARALYKKPNILILDEPTSALDSHSEAKIQVTLENLKHSITLVIVAHRLSTVRACEKIYYLENGKILEEGNFIQLNNLDGKFAKLVKLQEL
ncbi:ABC transporter, ATP-binding protein [Bacteriovorax sp. Seq25_V]|nr:ABC transporter, ATP-binding protein [Bacteriovorax sp. Seq25_V]